MNILSINMSTVVHFNFWLTSSSCCPFCHLLWASYSCRPPCWSSGGKGSRNACWDRLPSLDHNFRKMAGGVASAVLGDRQLIHAVLPSYEPPPEWRPAKDVREINRSTFNVILWRTHGHITRQLTGSHLFWLSQFRKVLLSMYQISYCAKR